MERVPRGTLCPQALAGARVHTLKRVPARAWVRGYIVQSGKVKEEDRDDQGGRFLDAQTCNSFFRMMSQFTSLLTSSHLDIKVPLISLPSPSQVPQILASSTRRTLFFGITTF